MKKEEDRLSQQIKLQSEAEKQIKDLHDLCVRKQAGYEAEAEALRLLEKFRAHCRDY